MTQNAHAGLSGIVMLRQLLLVLIYYCYTYKEQLGQRGKKDA